MLFALFLYSKCFLVKIGPSLLEFKSEDGMTKKEKTIIVYDFFSFHNLKV